MKIKRAEHLGWCFGVRDAVTLVEEQTQTGPVTVLGELVHNDSVNATLRRQGADIRQRLEEVTTDVVIITAHGIADRQLEQVRRRVPVVLEATCPLVRLAHRAVQSLVAAGYFPVIIGQRDHVEVRGLTGDLDEFAVVLSADDIERIEEHDRFGVVAQTTQPIERVKDLVARLADRFPQSEVRLVDTVCQPTKQRQWAAIELARQCDVVVVVGGAASNNTRELAESCARYCDRVIRVQTADELRGEWFRKADTVGLTAGTSTPDEVIDAVEQWLESLAAPARSSSVAEKGGRP